MSDIKTNSLKAWALAARPKTLSGALVPVCLGAALALQKGMFDAYAATMCAIFAGIMQIVANFVNDLYDYKKGTDRDDRLGPERACSKGWVSVEAMEVAIGVCTLIAAMVGCILLTSIYDKLPLSGWELGIIGLLCIVFAFLYTTYLSYRGWGDVLVLVFFGIIPVCGTYYVEAYSLNWSVVVASIISGLIIDTLLVVNNYRDVEQDKISGKNTVIVKYGKHFGEQLYLALGVIAAMLAGVFYFNGIISIEKFVAVALLYMGLHIVTWRKMKSIGEGKELNAILGRTSMNILIYGIALTLVIAL